MAFSTMFTHVKVSGLGPIAHPWEVELSSGSHRNRSRVGKTTVIEALSWLLFGVGADGRPIPQEAIHEQGAIIEARTASGSILRLASKSGKGADARRSVSRKGSPMEPQTAEQWERTLGPVLGGSIRLGSTSHALGRLVLAPMSWVPLMESEGAGRHLRDLIASLASTDPLPDAKAASEQARVARKEAEATNQRLASAEQRLQDLEASGVPSEQALNAAYTTDALNTRWIAYREQAKARETWQWLRDRAGEEPPKGESVWELQKRLSAPAPTCATCGAAIKSPARADAEARLSRAQEQAATCDRWKTLMAALPPEPPVPVPPEQPEPTEAEARDASRARVLARQAEAREQTISTVRRLREEAALGTRTVAQAEQSLADARSAPGARFAAGLAVLGLPDWIRIETGAGTDGQGVRLLVDGHPWRWTSSGHKVLADATIRVSLRNALGLKYLPVIVDNAQDWSGDFTELGVGVFLFYTEGAQ